MARPRRSTAIIAGLILANAGLFGALALLAIGFDSGPAGFLATLSRESQVTSRKSRDS